MDKTVPKIKVCHKSKEFAILTAMMHKLNSQNVQSGVTTEESISVRNSDEQGTGESEYDSDDDSIKQF